MIDNSYINNVLTIKNCDKIEKFKTILVSGNDLVVKQFSVLKKCMMLFIKELNPQFNTQKDSIRAKLYT